MLAIVITLSAAVYQRLTGPTYPLRGKFIIDKMEIKYKFNRSHGGDSNQPVTLAFPDSTYQAVLNFTYFRANQSWESLPMEWKNGNFIAELPNQPPAGKLEYFVTISNQSQKYAIPADRTVVTRFKGAVPGAVLIPHVLLMFIAMLLSNLSALEALVDGKRLKLYTILTTILLFTGGMILGPVVQRFAFGALWTGIPFGYDLTDNKTLLAMIGWLIAFVMVLRNTNKKTRWWVVAAALILLLIYSIPHSMLGSELDYQTMQVRTGQ
jgi:hypothetical protein